MFAVVVPCLYLGRRINTVKDKWVSVTPILFSLVIHLYKYLKSLPIQKCALSTEHKTSSSHFLPPLTQGHGWASAHPRCGREDGTLDRSPLINTEKQTTIHTNEPQVNVFGLWEVPRENPQPTRAEHQTPHRRAPSQLMELNLEPSCCEATVLIIAPLHHPSN